MSSGGYKPIHHPTLHTVAFLPIKYATFNTESWHYSTSQLCPAELSNMNLISRYVGYTEIEGRK